MNYSSGDELGSRYKLLEHLGGGGFAEVWRAEDLHLGRSVAIKWPKPSLLKDRPKEVAFFRQEARAASHLFNDPNIVAVLDFFEHDEGGRRIPCVVMEYVAGKNAKQFQSDFLGKRKDHLTRTSVALYLIFCAAKALMHAHEREVIHRDVKPDNILVSVDGQVKLADFGLSKFLQEPTRRVTGKYGQTVLYAAPEQVRGEPGSVKSDVYQLGCSLLEMLDGKAPFADAPSMAALVDAKVRKIEPIPLRLNGLSKSETRAVHALYRGMVQKNPADRWAAWQCVEALGRILHRPVWQLNFKPIAKAVVAERFVKITSCGEVPTESGYISFQDPYEAFSETVALLFAGASPYISLSRPIKLKLKPPVLIRTR